MYMEHMIGKKSCEFDGKPEAHGTELCTADGCGVCDDGTFTRAETTPPIGAVYFDPGRRGVWPVDPDSPLDCLFA